MKVGEGSVKPNSASVQKFARLQTLLTIQTTIAKMTRIKIADRNKPIMSAALEEQIEAVLAQFLNRQKWQSWGVDTIRKQGAALLLEGPPGTGKTTISRYMSKRIGKGMNTLNMKDVGGKAPGHTERMVSQFFQDAKVQGYKTIFLDECECLVWDRSKANSDSMWMVGVIDEILMQTVEYKGFIVLATNQSHMMDVALRDRCFACLQIGHPEFPERVRLWKQKIPERYPLQPTPIQFDRLAEAALTGRQIENAIVKEASFAIVQKREPKFTSLMELAKQLQTQTA